MTSQVVVTLKDRVWNAIRPELGKAMFRVGEYMAQDADVHVSQVGHKVMYHLISGGTTDGAKQLMEQIGYEVIIKKLEPEKKVSSLDSVFMNELRELCGYVENGSDTVVRIYEDDATRDWVVAVGKKSYVGKTLVDAFTQAVGYNKPKHPAMLEKQKG